MCWLYTALNAQDALAKRAEFVDYLRARGRPDSNYDDAELVYGELITNVIKHARGPIIVRLDWSDDNPVLRVIDRGAGFVWPAPQAPDVMSEAGRGLLIVVLLTKSLVVLADATGSTVTATLTVRRRVDERVTELETAQSDDL